MDSKTAHVFLHIPKTAGSTIRTLIAQNYARERTVAFPGEMKAYDSFRNRPDDAKLRFRMLHGHMPFGIHESMPCECRYFTFLREPTARYFSDYFFAFDYPAHNLHEKIVSGEMTCEDYAELPDREVYFDNTMTQYLSGDLFSKPTRETLEKAKRNLVEKMATFGIARRFDESILDIAHTFGWHKPFYLSKNISKQTIRNVSDEAREKCEKRQHLDGELFQFAEEVFDERRRQKSDKYNLALAALGRVEKIIHEGYDREKNRIYTVGDGVDPVLEELDRNGGGTDLAKDRETVLSYITAGKPEKDNAPVGDYPLVSVITRTKNRPALLRRALHSVAAQKYANVEWVVVNDGGEPGPVDEIIALAREQDINVAVVHNGKSKGMEAASNIGIARSTGVLLVIHDDDDSWHPDFLVRSVNFLQANPCYEGVTTLSIRIDESWDGSEIRHIGSAPYNPGLRSIYIIDLAQVNRFPPISFLFSRKACAACGGFDESLPVLGDWDFNLRFTEKFDIGVIPEPLANYHHRVSVNSGDDQYGNTVVQGVNTHVMYDAIVRNKLLRRDLESGRIGIGWLVSQGRQHQAAQNKLNQLSKALEMVRKVYRKIPFRSVFRRMIG